MKTIIAVKTAAAILALALGATACSGANANQPTAAGTVTHSTGSVRDLTTAAGKARSVDYTPLASPADAKRKAHLIVRGTLVQVQEGISLSSTDKTLTARDKDAYATFIIAVDKVIHGDPRKVRAGRVYLAIHKSSQTSTAQLARLNPQAKVVAVLDDITHWRPHPAVTVVRPANIPAQAPLYFPYTDGFWLQGQQDNEMLGIEAEPSELSPAWNHAKTVDQFAAALTGAAPRN